MLDPELRAALESIYEEMMWLSRRPNVTPGRARAWYTHVMAESVKRRVRRFTGYVSQKAIDSKGDQLMSVTARTWEWFFDPAARVHAFVAEMDGRIVAIAHFLFHRSTSARSFQQR